MVGIGLHILIAILLLIEHLFGTPSNIAMLKRQSIAEEYPEQPPLQSEQGNDTEQHDTKNDNQEKLNKSVNSKSSDTKGTYYSVPPEGTSTDEELDVAAEAKRTSTFKPNIQLDYEPSINESEIQSSVINQPLHKPQNSNIDQANKKKKKQEVPYLQQHSVTCTNSGDSGAKFWGPEDVSTQSVMPEQVAKKPKSKKSRYDRPRSKYYETEEVDPNDNTWI